MRQRPTSAASPRRWRRRRRLRPLRRRRVHAGHGALMAPQPIIFAMANPDPEITPEEALAARDDVIIATGRSDYPNQVNNVLAFPIFSRRARRARDDHQHGNEDRRRHALAELARETCPTKWPPPIRERGRASGVTISSRCRSIRGSSASFLRPLPRRRWRPASRAGRSRHEILCRAALGAARPRRRRSARIVERVRRNPKQVVFAEAKRNRSSARRSPSSTRVSARPSSSAARIA